MTDLELKTILVLLIHTIKQDKELVKNLRSKIIDECKVNEDPNLFALAVMLELLL